MRKRTRRSTCLSRSIVCVAGFLHIKEIVMLDITTAGPSAGSYGCDALSVAEIDAHEDCDRIWATVRALNDSADATISAARLEVDSGSARENDEAWEEHASAVALYEELEDEIESILASNMRISKPARKAIKAALK